MLGLERYQSDSEWVRMGGWDGRGGGRGRGGGGGGEGGAGGLHEGVRLLSR